MCEAEFETPDMMKEMVPRIELGRDDGLEDAFVVGIYCGGIRGIS